MDGVGRMRRILVLGAGGAGKTVLARQMSDALGIPVVHLDRLYYDEDWRPRPVEEFMAAQQRALASDKIILDGNYASTLPVRLAAADTVVLLDLPARTCLAGIACRRLSYWGGQHADGAFDRLTFGFVRYVINYRRRMLPRVLAMLAEHPGVRVIHLTSRRHVRRFLDDLRAGTGVEAVPDAAPEESS
jgi:hypothetical protein